MSDDCSRSKKKDYAICFILLDSSPELLEDVAKEGFHVLSSSTQWLETVKSCEGKRMLVIDSDDPALYDLSLQRDVRQSGASLMYTTVNNTPDYEADIVFNQNILALSQKFSAAPHTRLLLGPQYFIFREEFRQTIKPYQEQSIYSLVVAFGAADPSNLTSIALQVMTDQKESSLEHIHVVCGSLNPHLPSIESLLKPFRPEQVSLHVDTPHMLEIMEDSDAALVSLGLTFWETVTLGLPAMVVAASAREKVQFDLLSKKQYFYPVGTYEDTDLRERLSLALQKVPGGKMKNFKKLPSLQHMVNPRGVDRVVDEMAAVLEH